MKKAFLLLIAVIALSGTAWFNVSASTAGTVSADVYSWFFLDARAGQHVPAQLNNTAGDWQELSCEATGNFGYVSCQFPQEYAGQQVAVQLTKNDVMYVSVVDVPAK